WRATVDNTTIETSSNGAPHASAPIDGAAARDKILAHRTALDATFAERTTTIDACLLALLSGEHACLFGPPGTAKSYLVNAILAPFRGARIFSRLITKF